ncbi:hypothetical protein [Rhodoferax sp.]
MNFTITESEYNLVDAARAQLSLVAGLLTANGADAALYNASDLYAFIAAQTDTLAGVIKSVNDRYEAAKETDNVMSVFEWSTIIEVVSGRRSLRRHDLKALGRKLQNCTKVDPDMAHVFNAWKNVMTNGGELLFKLEPSSTDGFLIQFPERAPVMQAPETALKATAKKPAQRKRDKLTSKSLEVA